MTYYTYNQNNSGGRFTGPAHYVIVEARTPALADAIAEAELGLYFDGAGDCSCCGARWSSAWDDGDAEPTIYGDTDLYRHAEQDRWAAPGQPVVVVLHASGQQDVYRKPIPQPQVEG